MSGIINDVTSMCEDIGYIIHETLYPNPIGRVRHIRTSNIIEGLPDTLSFIPGVTIIEPRTSERGERRFVVCYNGSMVEFMYYFSPPEMYARNVRIVYHSSSARVVEMLTERIKASFPSGRYVPIKRLDWLPPSEREPASINEFKQHITKRYDITVCES